MPEETWDTHMASSYLLSTAAELMRDYDFDEEARHLASAAALPLDLGAARNEVEFRESLARILLWEPDQVEAAVIKVREMKRAFIEGHEFVGEPC